MKLKYFFTTYLLLLNFISEAIPTDSIVAIPDSFFKTALLEYKPRIDVNGDKEIQLSEAQIPTSLDVNSKYIRNLSGIEAFTALKNLDCNHNQLTSLDLSHNTSLIIVYCYNNYLKSLNTSQNKVLMFLECYDNQLTSLDLSQNTLLQSLSCSNNKLVTLDLSHNTALTYILCYYNQLTNLDLSHNTALTTLYCSDNKFTSLDVSQNSALTKLFCRASILTDPTISLICINLAQKKAIETNNISCIKDSTTTLSTTCTVGLESDTLRANNIKTLIRILTPLGQEATETNATKGLFLYQYSDGSIRKIIKE